MKVLVIGATGGVGSRLVPKLVQDGHDVHALHRRADQAEGLRAQGAIPHQGDLMQMEAGDFGALVAAMEAIVFSAGAGGVGIDEATRIDGDGPVMVIQAMKDKGVRRLVLVSAFPEAGRTRDGSETFEHYILQKKRADAAVAGSDLDWVVIRPGTLTDEAGNGRVTASRALTYGTVARDHVAQAIAAVLGRPWLSREIIELTDGDTDLPAAMDALRRAPEN